MSLTFDTSPIGSKISINIGLGVHHVGRKFDGTRVIEFSRKRSGWSIVPVETFASGKSLNISTKGLLPTQAQMLENMNKHANKKYSVLTFNCDSGAQILAELPPTSNQVTGMLVGAGALGITARISGASLFETLALIVIGGIVGVNIANILENKETGVLTSTS